MPGTVPTKSGRGDRKGRKTSKTPTQEIIDQNEELQEPKYAQRSWPLPEGVTASEVVSFSWYYMKLRIRVMSGQHHTTHSLGIKYRWHNWQHWQRDKRS